MPLYKLCFIEVCDSKVDKIVEAVTIDRTPPTGSLSTEMVRSERQRATSTYNCCVETDVRVLTMSSDMLEMYNTSPGLSNGKYVTRQHLAGLVTHMTENGWIFENKKYLDPSMIWASYD